MVSKKINVVWICHFSNAEIQAHLPIWKSKDEFAPWVPNMLKGFEDSSEIELSVISPHEYLRKTTEVKLRNINYYFIPFGIPFWGRHWPGLFRYDIYTIYRSFREKVEKIINKIAPDIVNLIGAENAYYSSSILDYKESYPVLITIQGFISQFKNEEGLALDQRKRIEVEEEILRTFKYFCGEQDSSTYISSHNPSHNFFKLYFPINEKLAKESIVSEKKYDCIYFGRLTKTKGIEDFIKVVAELKVVKPDVTACIIGGGDIKQWRKFAAELGCKTNIEFIGFVNTQKELFKYVKSSRIFLAPPFKERLSSTIREAMLMKVPIVAYATGGIPYLNEFDENILLVKTGEYKSMAEKALLLLQDENYASKLSMKAYHYAINEFSLEVNKNRLLQAYFTIHEENKNEH